MSDDKVWHYHDAAGEPAGPFSAAEMKAALAAGTITPQTLVWREGMAGWLPLADAVPRRGGAERETAGAPAAGAFFSPGQAPAPVAPAAPELAPCAKCGETRPIGSLVAIRGDRYCNPCLSSGQAFGSSKYIVSGKPAQPFASFWARVAAKLIDGVALTVLIGGLNAVVLGVMGPPAPSPGSGASEVESASPENPAVDSATSSRADDATLREEEEGERRAWALLKVLVSLQIGVTWLYTAVFLLVWGATPGKLALGIKVVGDDRQPIGWIRALLRYPVETLCAAICGIDYLLALFTEEKTTLHDMAMATRVVSVR